MLFNRDHDRPDYSCNRVGEYLDDGPTIAEPTGYDDAGDAPDSDDIDARIARDEQDDRFIRAKLDGQFFVSSIAPNWESGTDCLILHGPFRGRIAARTYAKSLPMASAASVVRYRRD